MKDKSSKEVVGENGRKARTLVLVEKFNTTYPNGTVYLRLTDIASESDSFQVYFRFHDEFVDSSIYDRGNAIIYASDAFYTTVQDIAYTVWPHKKIRWNNTRSIGYFNY